MEAILDCPVGKNLLQEEKNTVTILQAMIEVGEYHDFGTWVQRSMATMSSKVILLLLQAKQKMPIEAQPTRPTRKYDHCRHEKKCVLQNVVASESRHC